MALVVYCVINAELNIGIFFYTISQNRISMVGFVRFWHIREIDENSSVRSVWDVCKMLVFVRYTQFPQAHYTCCRRKSIVCNPV